MRPRRTEQSHEADIDRVRAEIRVWITRNGLTHAEVAERLGHPKSWVSKRIGAHPSVAITVNDLLAFADALDVAAIEFFRVAEPGATINYRKSA